jgi:uncharacterized cupredoxin-like copper-binding protein
MTTAEEANEEVTVRFLSWIGLAAVLVAAPLALASCGDDNGESSTAPTSASGAAESTQISETDFKLDPSDVTVKPGEVTFAVSNDGATTHTLEIEGKGVEEELEGDLAPGDEGELTVDLEPGTYEMYCPVDGHRAMGMEGEITVKG